MASAAEQLASSFSWSAIVRGELKDRLLFTLGALLIYRLGTFVPLPGIDAVAMAALFDQQQQGILGQLNLFAGGAVERMSVFALSILPYISASIIMQLMQVAVPALEQAKKEGEQGRRKINQYTRYLTVLLAAAQAFGIAIALEGSTSSGGAIVTDPGLFFRIQTVVTLTSGTIFLMWLGEQVTARGIGNGISLLIFAGIVAAIPSALANLFEVGATEAGAAAGSVLLIVIMLALVVFVVFMERAFRRLVVQYPKRVVGGNQQSEAQSSFLPLKLNTTGVIPAIFASSLLIMPQTIAGFNATGFENDWLQWLVTQLGRGQPLFMLLFAGLIIFFAFFYTSIVFNPEETADNLRKQGGYIPGVRPGPNTAVYLDYVLTRLTTVGAIYLAGVAILPEFLASSQGAAFIFSGMSVLIIVSVTIDTVQQIHTHIIAQQYEHLLAKQNLAGGSSGAKRAARRARRKGRP